VDQIPKLAKGFIRLGHDVRFFSYCNVLNQVSPFKSRGLSTFLFKHKVDELLASQIKNYQPHIIYINFPRMLDVETINRLRKAAPDAIFIGDDGDPWPKLQRNRIETAKALDIVTATNDGEFLQDYKDAGVPNSVFVPNLCDPDNDHRYAVGSEWRTDILWTGTVKHHASTSGELREQIVTGLSRRDNCTLYGCFGRPKIGGIDYLYAISGARIGVNVNSYSSVNLCHSDRLTHYLSCGTFVLANNFSDSELLFKNGQHLRYFNDVDEFFELTDWYLNHETERKKIADAGMRWTHERFNCVKIAGYILDLAEKGTYSAPWFDDTSD